MSGIVRSLKERFGKPNRRRRKLGKDEEEWYDTLSNLSVDSSDDEDDVYYDAPEEPIDVTTMSKRKRRHKKQAENKSNKNQATMNYHFNTQSAGRWRTGSNNGTSEQSWNVPSHSREIGFKYETGVSDSPIGTQTRAGVFHFGVGGPSSSTTSERDTTRPSTLNTDRPQTIDTRPSTSAFRLQSNIPEMGHQYKDGIADNKIEKLATSLMDIDKQRVIHFGRELGLQNVGKYCGYGIGKPIYKSKILLMLQDWKGRTPDAQQVQGLIQALKNANLEQLAGNLQDDPVTFKQGVRSSLFFKGRKVTVTLMTSSEPFIIEGLRTKLKALQSSRPKLIEAVRLYQLPYSGLKHHTFKEDVDIMVLCHSIENMRFSITNVTDSLYDEFLEYSNEKLGKDRIVVMAHDFPPEAEEVRAVKMDSFRYSQYSTFDNAGLVMICGRMDKREPEIRDRDWDSFVKFLENASKKPLPSKAPPAAQTSVHTDVASNTKQTSKLEERKIKPLTVSSSLSVRIQTRSSKPVIYICTSYGLHSIKGLAEMVQNSVKQCYSSCEIKETELPYSRLDDFKFPSEASKRDAMILCHSVHNRGYSITDVPNSLYNVFLKYCNQLFGKDRVAVIVHDFICSEEILKIELQSFGKRQPTAYKLVGFVALAGDLDTSDVKLCYYPESLGLDSFVRKLR
ncbi:uncharacterized protein LOC129269217 isoform X1 [Lytechinus pictus]|uniref:uncharacterized protein LOC129269217 isoform X1 n=1 Tax=Lytechinus pictus TaxID=7653 RepID=UPI0030BA2111